MRSVKEENRKNFENQRARSSFTVYRSLPYQKNFTATLRSFYTFKKRVGVGFESCGEIRIHIHANQLNNGHLQVGIEHGVIKVTASIT